LKPKLIHCFITLTFCGCIVIHKNFNAYKKPIFEGKQANKLQYNGIYYIKNPFADYPTPFIYFYNDGTVYLENAVGTSYPGGEKAILVWSNIKEAVDYYSNSWSTPPDRDLWGCFTVKDDSIYIQSFYRGEQTAIKRYMSEFRGIIKNDSTIELNYKMDYNPRILQMYSPSAQYAFWKTEIRPDNSIAWFLKKKWYQRELHNSRK
jgi:hypothetical protein